MMPDKLPKFTESERQVKKITFQKHPEEPNLITKMLNTYIEGFNLIESFTPTKDNEVDYAWLLLVTRSFHSMRCAMWLIANGYYGQAMSLLRTVTEDWFICKDCQNNPKTLQALLYKKYKIGDRKEGLTYYNMADRAGSLKIYREDYSYQSRFTHSTTLSLAILKDPEAKTLRTAPTYDDVLFLSCCEMMLRNALRMTEFVEALLSKLAENKADAWRKIAGQPCKEASEWLRALQEKYGANK